MKHSMTFDGRFGITIDEYLELRKNFKYDVLTHRRWALYVTAPTMPWHDGAQRGVGQGILDQVMKDIPEHKLSTAKGAHPSLLQEELDAMKVIH